MNFQQVPQDFFEEELVPYQFAQESQPERKWLFEIEEPERIQQPFYEQPRGPTRQQRSNAETGQQLLAHLKKGKEEKIIKDNKELFNANQAKSIYLTKISQLVETPKIQNKPKYHILYNNKKKRRSKVVQDSDSSDYGNGKSKLAKNRESARNSRKRKKIYIELLETKVQQLTEQVQELQTQLKERLTSYDLKEHIEQMKQVTSLEQLYQISENFGVNSNRRWTVCTELINQLIDNTIPFDLKRIMESANKCTDFFVDHLFEPGNFSDLRERIRQETVRLETATQQFGLSYDKIREFTYNLEKMKYELIQSIPYQDYIQYLK